MTHFDRLVASAMQRRIPLNALFELTGRCNLDCAHCHLDLVHPPKELSTAQACAIVDQLAAAGTLFLTLSGGELFLRRDALVIAEHARRRGQAVRLFTNATRIDRALARAIAEVRPLGVEVSVYGTGGAHAVVTQRRFALRRTLRGVLLLVRAGVPVSIKAPLLGSVAGELDDLLRLADRLGIAMTFDPFVTPRRDGELSPVALRAPIEHLASALAHPRLGWAATRELPPPAGPDDEPCAIGRRTCRIAPNGDLFPCSTWPEPIGNLLERPFAELWRGGELLDRLRAVRMRDLHGACTDCSQSGFCGRCMAVAKIEQGDAFGPADEACRIADAKELALGRTPARRAGGRVRLRVIGAA
jgi:radical SAM protein with 4Fe4S-binding SPASM domain